MATVLDEIIARKKQDLPAIKRVRPERALRAALPTAPPVRDFFGPLAAGNRDGSGPIQLIAEVKRASPSAGVIRRDFDPVRIARTYVRHGAACISVLTEETFFQGHLDYLRRIRAAVDVPLLRKDFIFDAYQLVEARLAGADAVLLIAECLDDCQLRSLYNQTIELGMTPLVEFYEPENLPRVLAVGATLIGINNRDLRVQTTDLEHTLRLRPAVPDDRVLVSESGIRTHDDVRRLQQAGVQAMLVGESLMSQPDIGAAVDRLLGRA